MLKLWAVLSISNCLLLGVIASLCPYIKSAGINVRKMPCSSSSYKTAKGKADSTLHSSYVYIILSVCTVRAIPISFRENFKTFKFKQLNRTIWIIISYHPTLLLAMTIILYIITGNRLSRMSCMYLP